MNTDSVTFIFFNSVLANNFVLAMFLGLCPFLGVSGKLNTAVPMGLATSFVMLVSSICAYFINELLDNARNSIHSFTHDFDWCIVFRRR